MERIAVHRVAARTLVLLSVAIGCASPPPPVASDAWYEADPMANRNGIGVVIHEEQGQWTVADVLLGSPAAQAGLKPGDRLARVGDRDVKEMDVLEVVLLLGSVREDASSALTVVRGAEGEIPISAKPLPLIRILRTHDSLNGDLGIAALCSSCRLCLPTSWGWANCGLDSPDPITGRQCSDACAVA